MFLVLLLTCLCLSSVGVRPVKSLSITIVVPDDYPSIKEAIEAANDGDTVFVRSGTYQQPMVDLNVPHLTINKSISLIGEDRNTTIIQAYYGEYPMMVERHIIVVEADNVVIKGFTFLYGYIGCYVKGSGCLITENNFVECSDGVALERSNNTVSNNYCVGQADAGIVVHGCDNNVIISNIVQNSAFAGIYVFSGSGNTVVENEVANCLDIGIVIDWFSVSNLVANNNVSMNGYGTSTDRPPIFNSGIALSMFSESNIIRNNCIFENRYGMFQRRADNNFIYHNSFINNQCQELDESGSSTNIWDNGYPDGGNYWSDYVGFDEKRGPYQNLTGTDGIGDTPYAIDGNNTDHYPLMRPYVYVLGDLNNDDKVDIRDIVIVASGFGSFPDHPRWNPEADINQDGIIDIRDIAIVASNFGMPL
jgi:parallel beta-helix repeat protein